MPERFLSRWARLKRERDAEDEATPVAVPADSRPAEPASVGHTGAPAGDAAVDGPGAAAAAGGTEARSRELPPVESLTPDSDFTPFLQRGVAPATRNAALKKLFADPAFNVMDGLDVYIEDFNKTTPIPDGLLRRLAQSRAVGLFDDLVDEPDAAGSRRAAAPEDSASPAEASSPGASSEPATLAAPEQGEASAAAQGAQADPEPARPGDLAPGSGAEFSRDAPDWRDPPDSRGKPVPE